jgi:hypothetical protein
MTKMSFREGSDALNGQAPTGNNITFIHNVDQKPVKEIFSQY